MGVNCRFCWTIIATVCLVSLLSCSTGPLISKPFQNPAGQEAQHPSSTLPPPQASSPTAPPPTTPVQPKASTGPMYYDFTDIPIPPELSVQAGDSFIFQNGQIKVGVLVLKGRVDARSLINFFQAAMVHNRWRPRAGFTSARSVLVYEKPEKICVINVQEKMLYTSVEIYVAPTSQQG